MSDRDAYFIKKYVERFAACSKISFDDAINFLIPPTKKLRMKTETKKDREPDRLLDSLGNEKGAGALRGKDVQVLIEPKANRRSRMENNYYWGVVVALIAEWMGDTAEATHEALRWRFLRRTNKRGMWTVKSTAELSTTEFEAYLSEVRQWASVQGVFIPLPNEKNVPF